MAIATQFGYTQDDLDDIDSATLWEEIQNFQEMQARRQPPPEPKKPVETPADEDEAFLTELEKTDVDPRYVQFLRRRLVETRDVKGKLAKVDEFEQRDTARANQQITEAIDAGFAKLAATPAFAALVGTGDISETTDPGHMGWRREIMGKADLKGTDTLSHITRKILATGTKLMGAKAVPASPPPPPAATKEQARDGGGRFTADQFAAAALPAAGERKVEKNGLQGAAVLHEYLREKGDPRGNGEYVDADDNSDLPE